MSIELFAMMIRGSIGLEVVERILVYLDSETLSLGALLLYG